MGYRSEVAIALTDDATRLLKAIEEHGVFEELLEEADGSYPKYLKPEDDNHCKLYWPDLKWYDSYPPIAVIHEFMRSLPDEDYLFLRSGEELEDNESYGAFHDSDMWITKSLQWN
jgi:hypothetical protein